VQEEISREISNQLRLNLTGEELKRLGKRYTENTEAYQLYLKGRYFADQYSEDGFKKAVDQFHLAIQKDSKYALAYAGLAETYWVASAQFLQPREAMPKAREAALEALKIDDTLAEAHTSLAAVLAFYDYDIVSSEREFKRALELNPGSASAHQWYAWYLFVLKRPEEALREIRRAQELDPLSLLINGEVGMAYYFARQYDRAIEEDKKAVGMDPNNSFARIGLTRSYIQIRKYEEAIATASKPEPDDSYLLASLGEAYARSGKTAEAQKVIDKLNELTKQRYVPPYAVAWIYVGLGQKQQALDWLEKSYANREDTMIWLNSDPSLDDLRSEPRFQDLVRRVGLPL
jgi:tetratricopeptide (TPR) repeat protein